METIVYQIELKDGRTFRVFCANSTQKKKVLESYYKIKEKVEGITDVVTGIHTAQQFEKLLTTF